MKIDSSFDASSTSSLSNQALIIKLFYRNEESATSENSASQNDPTREKLFYVLGYWSFPGASKKRSFTISLIFIYLHHIIVTLNVDDVSDGGSLSYYAYWRHLSVILWTTTFLLLKKISNPIRSNHYFLALCLPF